MLDCKPITHRISYVLEPTGIPIISYFMAISERNMEAMFFSDPVRVTKNMISSSIADKVLVQGDIQ